jgi:DNA-binding NtrC family response regulator
MPGMDGLELLGEIKQRRPDLPVVMVTAHGDDERRRRARELGAFEFITKPLDFDQLKEQLRPSQRTETLVRCYKRDLVSRITPITSSQKHPKQKLSVLIPAPRQILCPTSTAVLGRSCG